jgi:hypothetical protein
MEMILLCFYKEEASTKNLKRILTCYELMSGLRINYHKSELVQINEEDTSEVHQVSRNYISLC